jgi:hypothetical protein
MNDESAERLARVDVSLAKQLQASIERNARMTSRLRGLYGSPSTSAETVAAIEQILRAADDV